MPVEQGVTELNSDLIKGLNTQEVESRLLKNGSNTMVKNKHLSDLNLLFNNSKVHLCIANEIAKKYFHQKFHF